MRIRDSYELGEALVQQLARRAADSDGVKERLLVACQWALRYLEEGDVDLARDTVRQALREIERH
jgi:Tfp pilus assembly protein PilF